MTTKLLEGLTVVENSLLGPGFVGTFLADLGADVIKVESPAGDYIRQMTWPIVEGVSLLHLHTHRGKKSITLDLKRPEGRELYRQLVTKADAVIEAMRPGSLDKLGLGFSDLAQINPRIVLVTISGYGMTGPYKDMPSHGIAYDTWAGLIKPVTDDDGFTHIPPDMPNIGINTGPMLAAVGLLAAVLHARASGQGTHLEVAQSDAAAYTDWYRIESFRAYERPDTEVTGNPSDNYVRRPPGLAGMWDGVRYQIYESADGYVLFMASEQAFWRNFCAGVDRMDLFERWPGATYADHATGNRELQRELRDIFRTRTTAQWLEFGDEHNTTLAPVNTSASIGNDPQFHDRLEWLPASAVGCDQLPLPVKIVGEPEPAPPSKAPTVGQHNEEVARHLGYTEQQYQALLAAGAFGPNAAR